MVEDKGKVVQTQETTMQNPEVGTHPACRGASRGWKVQQREVGNEIGEASLLRASCATAIRLCCAPSGMGVSAVSRAK